MSLRLCCCLHSPPPSAPSLQPPPRPHNPPPSYRSSLTLPIYILHLLPLHPTYITRLNPAPHSHYPFTHLTLAAAAAAPQALLPLKHSSSLQACAAHCLSGLSHSLSPSSCSILHLAAPPSPSPAFTLTPATPTPTAPSPVISDALTPGGGSPLHSGVLKPATDSNRVRSVSPPLLLSTLTTTISAVAAAAAAAATSQPTTLLPLITNNSHLHPAPPHAPPNLHY
ncbi:hypothetical protein SprV_0301032000 [Sparganum proliferum]